MNGELLQAVLALREWKLSPPHYLFSNQPSRTKNFGADALSYVLELTVDQEQGFLGYYRGSTSFWGFTWQFAKII